MDEIFLQSDLFFSGVRPAINAGLSVSRVGGSAQIKAMKKVAGTLRLDLAAFRELEAFSQFGSSLDASTQARLDRGFRTVEILKQDLNKPVPVEIQVVALYSLTRGFLDDVPVKDILRFESEIAAWLESNHTNVLEHIRQTKDLPTDEEMAAAINEFKTKFAISE